MATPKDRQAGHRRRRRARESKNQSDGWDERDEEVECLSEEITWWLSGFRSKAGLRGNEKQRRIKEEREMISKKKEARGAAQKTKGPSSDWKRNQTLWSLKVEMPPPPGSTESIGGVIQVSGGGRSHIWLQSTTNVHCNLYSDTTRCVISRL